MPTNELALLPLAIFLGIVVAGLSGVVLYILIKELIGGDEGENNR